MMNRQVVSGKWQVVNGQWDHPQVTILFTIHDHLTLSSLATQCK